MSPWKFALLATVVVALLSGVPAEQVDCATTVCEKEVPYTGNLVPIPEDQNKTAPMYVKSKNTVKVEGTEVKPAIVARSVSNDDEKIHPQQVKSLSEIHGTTPATMVKEDVVPATRFLELSDARGPVDLHNDVVKARAEVESLEKDLAKFSPVTVANAPPAAVKQAADSKAAAPRFSDDVSQKITVLERSVNKLGSQLAQHHQGLRERAAKEAAATKARQLAAEKKAQAAALKKAAADQKKRDDETKALRQALEAIKQQVAQTTTEIASTKKLVSEQIEVCKNNGGGADCKKAAARTDKKEDGSQQQGQQQQQQQKPPTEQQQLENELKGDKSLQKDLDFLTDAARPQEALQRQVQQDGDFKNDLEALIKSEQQSPQQKGRKALDEEEKDLKASAVRQSKLKKAAHLRRLRKLKRRNRRLARRAARLRARIAARLKRQARLKKKSSAAAKLAMLREQQEAKEEEITRAEKAKAKAWKLRIKNAKIARRLRLARLRQLNREKIRKRRQRARTARRLARLKQRRQTLKFWEGRLQQFYKSRKAFKEARQRFLRERAQRRKLRAARRLRRAAIIRAALARRTAISRARRSAARRLRVARRLAMQREIKELKKKFPKDWAKRVFRLRVRTYARWIKDQYNRLKQKFPRAYKAAFKHWKILFLVRLHKVFPKMWLRLWWEARKLSKGIDRAIRCRGKTGVALKTCRALQRSCRSCDTKRGNERVECKRKCRKTFEDRRIQASCRRCTDLRKECTKIKNKKKKARCYKRINKLGDCLTCRNGDKNAQACGKCKKTQKKCRKIRNKARRRRCLREASKTDGCKKCRRPKLSASKTAKECKACKKQRKTCRKIKGRARRLACYRRIRRQRSCRRCRAGSKKRLSSRVCRRCKVRRSKCRRIKSNARRRRCYRKLKRKGSSCRKCRALRPKNRRACKKCKVLEAKCKEDNAESGKKAIRRCVRKLRRKNPCKKCRRGDKNARRDLGRRVRLTNGARNVGRRGYARARYVNERGMCHLYGIIRADGGTMAQLHRRCRPSGRLIFTLVTRSNGARVDVLADGRVIHVVGPTGWFSLSGITFARDEQTTLNPVHGAHYGGEYRRLALARYGNLCVVSGLMTVYSSHLFHLGSNGGNGQACTPDSHIMFATNNHETSMRVDVYNNGWVVSQGGNHGWRSVSGIMYPARAGHRRLAFRSGWQDYHSSWRAGHWKREGRFCLLTGMLAFRSGGNGVGTTIARLPRKCRPIRRQVFAVAMHGSQPGRVDVLRNGRVKFVNANGQHAGHWVDIDGVRFIYRGASKRVGGGGRRGSRRGSRRFRRRALSLNVGAYGGEYGQPRVAKQRGLCLVSGLTSSTGFIGTLPGFCHPREGRLITHTLMNGCTARVDVLENGQIHFIVSNCGGNWQSLNGVTFAPRPGRHLSFGSGWANYDHGYRRGSLNIFGRGRRTVCVLSGLIRSGGSHLLTLPSRCNPESRLIFSINNHQFNLRVDVTADGQVLFVAGSYNHGWMALDGMVWTPRIGSKSVMEGSSGWADYANGYRSGTFRRVGRFCFLSGLIRVSGGFNAHVGTLPRRCRPYGRQVFAVNIHENAARVDVLANGEVQVVSGYPTHGWLSLDRIAFATRRKQARKRYDQEDAEKVKQEDGGKDEEAEKKVSSEEEQKNKVEF